MASEGVLIGLERSWSTPFEVIPYVPEIPSKPTSAILFAIFGLILYFRFKGQAPLIFGFSYSVWDLISVPGWYLRNQSLTGSGVPYYSMYYVWGLIIIATFIFVKPKIDLTHYMSVIFFIYWISIPAELLQIPGALGGDLRGITGLSISEIMWFAFFLKSVYPKAHELKLAMPIKHQIRQVKNQYECACGAWSNQEDLMKLHAYDPVKYKNPDS
jgi:hypothetical protein